MPVDNEAAASVETPATPVAPENVNVDSAFSQAFQTAETSQPTPAAPPAEVTQPAAQPNELFEQARSLGINVGEAKSEADIARALISQYKQVQPYASLGQQVAPYHDKFQAWLQSQEQQPQEKETPAEAEWNAANYFNDQWKVPQLSPQIEHAIKHGLVHQNENGAWEPAAGYELMVAPLVNDLNQYHVAKQQHVQDIFGGNPYEKFHNVLLEPMRRAWQEDFKKFHAEQAQTQQSQDVLNQYDTANAAWLYSVGADGQKTFTAEGQRMAETMARLRRGGMTDHGEILQLAEELVRPNKGAAAATQAAPAASPAVPASTPPPDPATASNLQKASFLENAEARARHSPNSGGFTQVDDDHPVNLQQGELENLFVNASRAKKVQAA